jgi:hypothetical protein
MHDVRAYRDVVSSPKSAAQCRQVEETVRFLADSIRERLAEFQDSFEMFWANINRASFQQLRMQIEKNHSTMGAVLCGLVVKMHLWRKEFRDNATGGPATRIKFVVSEIEPGLARLRELETAARTQLGMKSVKT